MEKFKAEKEPTSAAELRKINKPLMEKRRRERINNCLDQLKHFLIEATKRDSSYYSKLEKADILEMTVKYLKNLQNQQLAVAIASEPHSINKYTAGFNECAAEVGRYLGKIDGLSPDIKTRMQSHLNNCLTQVKSQIGPNKPRLPQQTVHLGQPMNIGIQMPGPSQDQKVLSPSALPSGIQQVPSATPLASLPGIANSPATAVAAGSQFQATTTQQNPFQNVPIVPAQLVPAKLPTGELVLLLANAQGVPNFQPAAQGSSPGTPANPFVLNSPQYASPPLATSSPIQSRATLQHQSPTFSPPFSMEAQNLKTNKNEHHKSATSTITRDPSESSDSKSQEHFEMKHTTDANQNLIYESDKRQLTEGHGSVSQSNPLPLVSNSPSLQQQQRQQQQEQQLQQQQQQVNYSNDPVWRPWCINP